MKELPKLCVCSYSNPKYICISDSNKSAKIIAQIKIIFEIIKSDSNRAFGSETFAKPYPQTSLREKQRALSCALSGI